MRIVLLGAPGSGKGTQGTRLADRLGVAHVSSGDLLRALVAGDTDLGRRVAGFVTAGLLVPDDLVLEVIGAAVLEAARAGGYVLDGFPRTLSQAERAYGHHADQGESLGHDGLLEAAHSQSTGKTDALLAEFGIGQSGESLLGAVDAGDEPALASATPRNDRAQASVASRHEAIEGDQTLVGAFRIASSHQAWTQKLSLIHHRASGTAGAAIATPENQSAGNRGRSAP